jgi:hypothetical protein
MYTLQLPEPAPTVSELRKLHCEAVPTARVASSFFSVAFPPSGALYLVLTWRAVSSKAVT